MWVFTEHHAFLAIALAPLSSGAMRTLCFYAVLLLIAYSILYFISSLKSTRLGRNKKPKEDRLIPVVWLKTYFAEDGCWDKVREVLYAADNWPKHQLQQKYYTRNIMEQSCWVATVNSNVIHLIYFTGRKAAKEYLGKRLIKSCIFKPFTLLLISYKNKNGKRRKARIEVLSLGRF